MINNQKILYKFIQTNNNVNLCEISFYYKLSENFIRKFQDKVEWHFISEYQNLSESFIREFKDKVYWIKISVHQKLSESFIRDRKSVV